MTKFEDIRIIGMDKDRSKIVDSYSWIYLTLSSTPDKAWGDIFLQMYMRSRAASDNVKLSGIHIVMKTPRERAKELKDKLETDVADTNSCYRQKLEKEAKEAEAQRVKQEKEREKLDDIESLLFDED